MTSEIGFLFWSWLDTVAGPLLQQERFMVWCALGLVGGACVAWMSHRLFRRLLGHTLFRGTWYDARQSEALVKQIDADIVGGGRVMRRDEMRLIRRWRFGRDTALRHRSGSYF
jgi:hypothetical protein